jgi:hypothetical protein
MTRALFFFLAAAIGGCSSNPCDGRGASCVNALVQGYAGMLNQLRITIDQPSATSTTTPNPPSSFTLPVKVALVLPPGTSGALTVDIDGLSSQQVVASAAPRTITVPSKDTITFTLMPGTGDGGTDDLSAPPSDLAGIVSVVPSSFNFSVGRGSSDTKMFHVGNGTTAQVAASPALAGNAAFSIASDGCAGAMLDPGTGCDVTVKFSPTVTASALATTLTVAGVSSSVTGDANAAWTSETPASAATTAFRALGSRSTAQQLAGGAHVDPNNTFRIFASSGATWSQFGPQPPDDVNGLAPVDGGTLVVTPTGIFRSDSNAFNSELSNDPASPLRGVIAGFSFGDVAVGSAGIYRNSGTGWFNDGPGHGDGGVTGINAVATDGTYIYCVTVGAAIYRGQPMASFTPYTPVQSAAGGIFNAVWVPPGAGPSNVWVVANDATIWHIPSNFVSADQPVQDTVPAGVSGSLFGIDGVRSGGSISLVAVGSGGLILRSSGNGTWTRDTSPTTQTLRAVHVVSLTEAYAVGDSGTIIHYY